MSACAKSLQLPMSACAKSLQILQQKSWDNIRTRSNSAGGEVLDPEQARPARVSLYTALLAPYQARIVSRSSVDLLRTA